MAQTRQIQYIGGKAIQLGTKLSDGRSIFRATDDNGNPMIYEVSLEDYNFLFSNGGVGFVDVTKAEESIAEPLDVVSEDETTENALKPAEKSNNKKRSGTEFAKEID